MENPSRTAFWETFGCMYGIFVVAFLTIAILAVAYFLFFSRLASNS